MNPRPMRTVLIVAAVATMLGLFVAGGAAAHDGESDGTAAETAMAECLSWMQEHASNDDGADETGTDGGEPNEGPTNGGDSDRSEGMDRSGTMGGSNGGCC